MEVEEALRDGDSEGCAFFGVGGGAEFVEEDERVGCGFARDAVEVDDVGGEAGEVALDGLGVADVGVDGGEERESGFFGRNGQAGLRHNGEKTQGLQGDGLAAGVGAADDELAGFGRKGDRERDWSFGGFAGCARFGGDAELEEGMASGSEGEF